MLEWKATDMILKGKEYLGNNRWILLSDIPRLQNGHNGHTAIMKDDLRTKWLLMINR
jgi:hypothetical protein